MIRAANVRLFGWAITNRLKVTSNSHFSIGLSNPVQPIAGHVKFTGVTSAASELTTFKIGSHGARAVQEIGFRSQLSNSSLFWIGNKICDDPTASNTYLLTPLCYLVIYP